MGKRFLEFNKIWCQETLILGPSSHGDPPPFIRAFIYFENVVIILHFRYMDLNGIVKNVYFLLFKFNLKTKTLLNNNLWTCKLFIWWSMTSMVTFCFIFLSTFFQISLLFKLYSYQNFITMLTLWTHLSFVIWYISSNIIEGHKGNFFMFKI